MIKMKIERHNPEKREYWQTYLSEIGEYLEKGGKLSRSHILSLIKKGIRYECFYPDFWREWLWYFDHKEGKEFSKFIWETVVYIDSWEKCPNGMNKCKFSDTPYLSKWVDGKRVMYRSSEDFDYFYPQFQTFVYNGGRIGPSKWSDDWHILPYGSRTGLYWN